MAENMTKAECAEELRQAFFKERWRPDQERWEQVLDRAIALVSADIALKDEEIAKHRAALRRCVGGMMEGARVRPG